MSAFTQSGLRPDRIRNASRHAPRTRHNLLDPIDQAILEDEIHGETMSLTVIDLQCTSGLEDRENPSLTVVILDGLRPANTQLADLYCPNVS